MPQSIELLARQLETALQDGDDLLAEEIQGEIDELMFEEELRFEQEWS